MLTRNVQNVVSVHARFQSLFSPADGLVSDVMLQTVSDIQQDAASAHRHCSYDIPTFAVA